MNTCKSTGCDPPIVLGNYIISYTESSRLIPLGWVVHRSISLHNKQKANERSQWLSG